MTALSLPFLLHEERNNQCNDKSGSTNQCLHDRPGFNVVFSSSPISDLTSQNPESLKCEQTVAPPATAATTHARYIGDKDAISGIAATIPAAMVIATVAEPTQILTSAATKMLQ